jgi:hypothetical protein
MVAQRSFATDSGWKGCQYRKQLYEAFLLGMNCTLLEEVGIHGFIRRLEGERYGRQDTCRPYKNQRITMVLIIAAVLERG